MTIAEIRTMEEARHEAGQLNVVHLIKEGDWYRAHDWSAWLMTRFPTGEAVSKPLKVTARRMKDGYVDAFVGFPCSSLGKFLVGSEEDFQPVSNERIDVTVELTPDIGEVSFDSLSRQKEEWKASLPAQETSSKRQHREDREALGQAPRAMRMSDIVGRLVAIPLEDISYREAFDILRELRRQALSLF